MTNDLEKVQQDTWESVLTANKLKSGKESTA